MACKAHARLCALVGILLLGSCAEPPAESGGGGLRGGSCKPPLEASAGAGAVACTGGGGDDGGESWPGGGEGEPWDGRIRAYVLNVPGEDTRWRNVQAQFEFLREHIELVRWPTVPLDDPRMTLHSPPLTKRLERVFLSNFLSFGDAWAHFAADSAASLAPNRNWAIFLEDDVRFHPDVRGKAGAVMEAIRLGLELGEERGFVYLGMGNMELCGFVEGSQERTPGGGIELITACGWGAHAFAVARGRAATLLQDLETVGHRSRQPKDTTHQLTRLPDRLILDFHFVAWCREARYHQVENSGMVWVVGSNLKSPHFESDDGRGLLYQASYAEEVRSINWSSQEAYVPE